MCRVNGTERSKYSSRHGLVSPLNQRSAGAVPGNGRSPADPVGTAARKGGERPREGREAGRRWLPPGRATRWPAAGRGPPGVLHAVSPRCPAFRRPSVARSIDRSRAGIGRCWEWDTGGDPLRSRCYFFFFARLYSNSSS
ncbi:hypothetical protein GQ55_9G471600 [Panicum hallii var. hallii]|uniref:Uncharacterized protein n=1 Tax=Panicum hallii var. hallii TaxID=1504633 RepID=A0A2T7CCR5_9POAL|nr:hypothetical protein GQ55_9G471600 [Panicum hallii var. hallii]